MQTMTGAVFATLVAVSFAPLARSAEPSRIAQQPGLYNLVAAAIQEPKPEEQKPDGKPAKPVKEKPRDMGQDKPKDDRTQTKPQPQRKA